jgi:hypothetical protein
MCRASIPEEIGELPASVLVEVLRFQREALPADFSVRMWTEVNEPKCRTLGMDEKDNSD